MPQWLVIGVSGVTCGGKTTLAHCLRDYFQGQLDAQLLNTQYIIADVQLISQDDYFLPVDDLRHKWNDKLNVINFELITALNMKQMLSDITWTMKGQYLRCDPLNNIDFINEVSMYSNFERYTLMHSTRRHSNHSQGHISNNPQRNNHSLQHQQKALGTQNPVQNALYNRFAGSRQVYSTTQILHLNSQIATHVCDTKINILIIEGFMIFNQPELLTLCNVKFHLHLPYEKCFERRKKRTYDPPDSIGYFEICVWPHYEKNFSEYRERKDICFLNGETIKEKIFKFVLQKIGAYIEERSDFTCPLPQKFLGMLNNSNNGTKKKSFTVNKK